MLHRTGKRSGTTHAISQISPKLAQIRKSSIPIPGDDGQVSRTQRNSSRTYL